MTLIELKNIIDYHISQGDGSAKVVIPNNKNSIGHLSATVVKSAGIGFDWNRERFFIFPENKMVEEI